MNGFEKKARLRKEADILDRIESVKRLIQMETTIMTETSGNFARYKMSTRKGESFGGDLIDNLREDIQLQLLSVVALCYGDAPDIGEPCPVLEWQDEDKFREVWSECLSWNA